jgi:anti-sigma factor RsiW
MRDAFQDHVTQVALESYTLGELREPEAAEVEEHLLVCETCRQALSEADAFGALIRGRPPGHAAAAFVHATEDGLIRLELRALPGARWSARLRGDELEGQATLASPREAYRHLRCSFTEMFPEHLCNSGCGPAR